MVLTFVPASLEDLRCLTMNPEAIEGRHPDIIDIIAKDLPSEAKVYLFFHIFFFIDKMLKEV